MKIILLGYGKMGKSIEHLVSQDNTSEIIDIFDSKRMTEITSEKLSKADIIIDFTRPEVAASLLLMCAESGTPTISGTTGWLEDYKKVCKAFVDNDNAFLYASNFSIGMNIFFQINQTLAKIMNQYNYDCQIEEIHHTQKLDAPSGTAISIAEQIIVQNDKYKSWHLSPDQKPKSLNIEAIREGNIKGIHTVKYTSALDKIEFRHEATDRKAFSQGALVAAKWLVNKKGIFDMGDVIGN